jgi:hypothetical protein
MRRFSPNAARRSEIHRQIEERCGLSQGAAMLLVELDVFGEVLIDRDEHVAELAELLAKGLAELAHGAYACTHVRPSLLVREILNRIRSLMALEAELARRERAEASDRPRDVPKKAPPAADAAGDEPSAAITGAKLTPELERAIVEDALALIDQHPIYGPADKVRVYLRRGRRFVRVYWTPKSMPDGSGSLLYYVEIATGRIFNRGGSSKKVPTSRFVGDLHA